MKGSRRTRRAPLRASHPRDTDATAFTGILVDLLSHVPGAHSAAIVDPDGETVDYTGRAAPFDVKLAAAEFRVTFDRLRSVPFWREAKTLLVRGSAKSFLVHALSSGYAIVVIFGKRGGFSASARALSVCERALEAEAGLIGGVGRGAQWMPVAVGCDPRQRPMSVSSPNGGTPHSLEVLGSVMGLGNRDRAFRVRLDTGAELMLVRERGGAWYSEEPIDFAHGGRATISARHR
jgi:hypothetical protein